MELLVSIYGGKCRIVRDVGRKERIEMARKRENEGKKKTSVMAWKRGAWSAEEDRKLAEYVTAHGDKRWTTVAAKAGKRWFSRAFNLLPWL
ncbi:Myb-like DNA-binding domain [Musa troglodytarum]|uniref:Myb-like DNA-binding domain n=1 Tax=Musa troglodytarum TaxID=320322 RepID=A0A9E7FN70_9LILI|nr:Myb-like DNA-binding domain [Musa troglodytarum]